ncbi:Tat pathway signal protein [Actinoplanes sp. NEAU-H7]|uniref:Tat pathway signal protein n=1 Tax=Actinoplanes flavus TaxID=2820290 RepID=A0ABS3UCZ3_9ACTN|nr:Tat pathway signal protein [Actinoplanes flavus]
MPQSATGNEKLAAVLAEAGMSHGQAARAFVRVAAETGAAEFAGVGRSHVSKWVAGVKPSGRAPLLLCETLGRKLGRTITPEQIGLDASSFRGVRGWDADTLVELTDLGRCDVDIERRRLLNAAVFSVAALGLPRRSWWDDMGRIGRDRHTPAGRAIGHSDVDAVRDMVQLFSHVDQKRGGGHGRTAVVQYLTDDVAGYLHGRFADDQVRRDMFVAASELAYLSGWMAFDNAEHAIAQNHFRVAVKLAAEADEATMAGHVLRAMAHQAVDLGHYRQAHDLAEASVDGRRYTDASHREKALLGVVHARALAVCGDSKKAATTLLQAETDLADAQPGDDEPGRVFFFGEASLAHETACALRDTGDFQGAISQFRRSVRTRKATTFTRTHAVTLGYLGAVHAGLGEIDQACATWNRSLDAMQGVRSGRTRQVATDIRATLSPFRGRGIPAVTDTDARAAAYLAATS